MVPHTERNAVKIMRWQVYYHVLHEHRQMVERSIKELLCLACQLVQKLRIRACRQAERKDFLSGKTSRKDIQEDMVYTEHLTGLLSCRNK
jgi:hypothetical protein